jgi:hypothetical protein
LDLPLPVQSDPITTDVVFKSRSVEVFSKQHYLISFPVTPGTPVSSTNKTDRHDVTEVLLKVALNTIKQTNKQNWYFALS